MRGIHGGKRRSVVAVLTALGLIGSTFYAAPPAGAAVASAVVNTTVMVSRDASGAPAAGAATSSRPAVSTDGQYVAFVSNAALVPGDTNGWADVYRKNVSSGAIDWVTEIGNGSNDSPYVTISDDGRYISFSSDASSYIGMTCEFCWNDTNNRTDIFRRDMSLPTNDIDAFKRINVGDAGDVSLSSLYWSASSDGTKFAFFSENGLDDNETVRNPGVYTRKFDVAGNDTTFIHEATAGPVAISGDGTKVVYQWDSPSVSAYAIYLTDSNDTVVSAYNLHYGLSANNADPIGLLGPDSMSQDGNITVFWSDGDAYPDAPGTRARQVYAYDHAARKAHAAFSQQIELMSRAPGTPATQADAEGSTDSAAGGLYPKGAVSDDGNRVTFTTSASDIVASAPNGGLILRERSTGDIGALSVDAAGATQPVVDGAINPNGNVVAYSTSHAMTGNDTNSAIDVYARAVPEAPAPAAAGDIDISVEPNTITSTFPGFSMLDTDDIPATAIPLGSADEVSGAPLRSVDLAASPLRSVPLRSVPLRSVPLRSVPLRSVTLSQLPLRAGTWEALLDQLNPKVFAGVPLQSITLDAALTEFEKQAKTTIVDAAVTLENIDLASTPLRSVSLASIALGATPLRSVPVPGPSTDVFTNWCTLITSLGYDCAALGLTADSPILAADLAGVPLRSVPLRSVPLRSVPLRSVDLQSSPLRSVPLRSVFLDGIALGTLPLSKIGNLDAGGNLVPPANPGLLVDCVLVDCVAGTLADAFTADAILAGKTLGDLFDHVDLDELPGSLAELIEGLVDTKNFPWETIPLDGLQQYAGENSRQLTYTVTFDVTGNQPAPATINVVLPPGFQYVPFSTVDPDSSDDVSSPGIYGAPVVNGQSLTWTANVVGGNAYDFTFRAFPGFELADDAVSSASLTVGGVTSAVQNQAPIDIVEDFEFSPIFFEEVTVCGFCDTYSYSPASFDSSFSPIIPSNTLITSHIGTSGDVDLFRVPVPPKGTRMQIHLGNRSADTDFDVAMLNTATDSTPLRSVPLRSVPLRSVPLADNGVDASAADSSLSPETLDDIPNLETAPLRSVGENRGVADEFLATVSDADPLVNESQQYYTLQVSAYNGGSSKSPYVLFVKTYTPPPAPECPSPKAFANAGQGVAGTAPTLPDGLNTLFLVNQKRMGDTFGAVETAAAIAKLNTLADEDGLGVVGAVYPVESSPAVATAFENWDLDPCNTDSANAVFNAVGEVVDSVSETHGATLKNIVVVGGDDIIPMARIADYTQISNESDYAAGALLTTGTDRGTPIAAAAASQNFLSDDPLADTDPIPWLDHTLFVPDLAIGRLVETPAEIGAQVDQFVAAQGRLNPQKSLSTGYDFLTDGTLGVDAALGNRLPAAQRTKLVNETWTKADALAALFPATGSPDIASINAHYDHTRALPALGNSTHDESDLVTTAEIAAHPNTLNKRLLFTMGCHAGLSVPKSYTDDPDQDADWAQTYVGGQKAAVYLANTGFGYGDTAAVALSEELMRQFAMRLNGSMTVGEAATYAKQAYFGQLGLYGPYDEKAMQEAAFYGLPMWKIGDGTTPPPALPTPLAPVEGAVAGVYSAPVSVSSTFTRQTSKGGGAFFTAAATGTNVAGTGLQVTQYRPIEPRVSVDVTPVEGVGEPHGVLITDLESTDVASVPAVARPVIDLTSSEPPPPAGDVSFPTSFDTLTTFNTPQGERDHVVFLPGQFFRDASWANAGGVQRLFDDIDADVLYSDTDDWLSPQLTNVEATLTSGQLTISLLAHDDDGFAGGVTRVAVLVKDQTGEWTLHDLADQGNNVWSSTFAVTGTDVEYFAQATDSSGNVGRTTNKGRYFSGLPQTLATGTPDLKLTPGQPTGSNGWYRGPVTVTLQGTPNVAYTKSVDGGAPTTYTGPVTLTGDGSHSVKAVGSDGSTDTVVAVIDTTSPTFTSTPDRAPNGHGWYNAPVTFATSCSDATSGVQICPGGAVATEGAGQKLTAFDFAGNTKSSALFNIDMTPPVITLNITDGQIFNGIAPDPTCTATDALSGALGCVGSLSNAATPGWYSYTAVAQDKAGNVATKTITFKASYLFGGFQQPVNDTGHYVGSAPPPYSVFAGGSTIPLKFKLVKQDGTFATASATPTFSAVRMGPLGGIPVNEPVVTTAPTPGNLFTYDAASKTYSFNWKTDKKSMSGYYWQVRVLIDGQTITVLIGLK